MITVKENTLNWHFHQAARWAMLASIIVWQAMPPLVMANPSGENVVAGSATFSRSGSTLTINQGSNRAIINWNDFSIGAGELTKFVQPGLSSAVLNRVTGGNASAILGRLQANGSVYLINSNGILVGSGAQINVGSFIASTLDVNDSDFMAGGDLLFSGASTEAIINHGSIEAIGGNVTLISREILNTGTLSAADGAVHLAAGSEVLLKADGNTFIQTGSSSGTIKNSGLIEAARAELKAAGGNPYALAINNEGVIRATGYTVNEGVVSLVGKGGKVSSSGTIAASRTVGGIHEGGRIVITGDIVELLGNAEITANANDGDGGEIYIGGGFQGRNPDIYNATETHIGSDVVISADAGTHGNGGTVILWSDGLMSFKGHVNVRGGSLSGDGGFTEVSGKQDLIYRGTIDNSAAFGEYGMTLLDPSTITIVSGSAGTTGTQSDWEQEGGGAFTIAETVLEALTGTVTLRATADLIIEDLADNELTLSATNIYFYANDESSLTSVGGVTMRDPNDTVFLNSAGGELVFQGGSTAGPSGQNSLYLGNLKTAGSNIRLLLKRSSPSLPVLVEGSMTSNGGNISIEASTRGGANSNEVDVTLKGLVNTGGGNFVSNMTGQVNINGGMNLGNGSATFGGTQTNINSVISSTTDFTVGTPLVFGAGSGITTTGKVTFTSTASMASGGSLTLTANDFDFQNTFTGNNATITLKPYNQGTNVDIGSAGTGDMLINAANLAKLSGFANVIIGRVDGTGTTTVVSDTSFSATSNFELINQTIDITGGTIENTTGDVTLTGDTINITKSVTASGSRVTIQQLTAANTITLGSDLTDAKLGHITADTLVIGRTDGGAVTIAQDLNATTNTTHIRSGAGITGTAGGVNSTNLALTAGGTINITDTDTNFSKLAVSAAGQSVTIISSNAGGFDIGTVDTVNGITAGTFNLVAYGSVTDSQAVQVGNLTVDFANAAQGSSLTLDHASTQVGTIAGIQRRGAVYIKDTSGDLIVSGTIDKATGDDNDNAADVTLITPGNLTLASGSSIVTKGSGNEIILSADGNFINQVGAGVLSTDERWVVYSNTPGSNTFGGLISGNTAYWNSHIGNRAPASITGNRYVFRTSPTLTITPDAVSKTYGDTASLTSYSSSGLITNTYGGVYVADTDAGLTGAPNLTSAGSAATANAGSYTINAALGTLASSKGYSFSYGTNTLTVNPAAITVKPVNGSSTIGSNPVDPGLEAVSGSLKNSDTFASIGLGSDWNIDNTTPKGSYTVSVTGTANGNYTLTTQTGTWTVGGIAITVRANGGTSIYGESPLNPGLTLVSGTLEAGDTLASIGLSNSFSITPTTIAGTYNLLVNGDPGKYTVTAELGEWIVNPLTLGVARKDEVIVTQPDGKPILSGNTGVVEVAGVMTLARNGQGKTTGIEDDVESSMDVAMVSSSPAPTPTSGGNIGNSVPTVVQSTSTGGNTRTFTVDRRQTVGNGFVEASVSSTGFVQIFREPVRMNTFSRGNFGGLQVRAMSSSFREFLPNDTVENVQVVGALDL